MKHEDTIGTKRAKVLGVAIILFIMAVIASLPAAFILLLKEESPIPVGTSKREVLTPFVAPGEKLIVHIEADLTKTGCKAKVFRSIVDSANVVTNYDPEERPSFTKYDVPLTVALGAAPGDAEYQARVEWNCNFIQAIFPRVTVQRPLKFIIVPADNQKQLPDQQGIYEPAPSLPKVIFNGPPKFATMKNEEQDTEIETMMKVLPNAE